MNENKIKREIIPAILPRDWNELEEGVNVITGAVKNVQIDICDGQLTRVATWPYKKSDDNFEKLLKEEIGLPRWKDIDYEFDLMLNFQSGNEAMDFVRIGAKRIVIHDKSKGDLMKIIDDIHGTVEIGLELDMSTQPVFLEQYVDKIDFVQCMGIDEPGFQGQNFNSAVIDKIKKIREKYPDMPISVDGGVSEHNARSLLDAGANRLVIGSQIFGNGEILDNIARFQRMI